MSHKLLKNALAAFIDNTGLRIDIEHEDYLFDNETGPLDLITMRIEKGLDLKFLVRVENKTFSNAFLSIFLHQRSDMKGEYKELLVAKYVNPKMAEKLKGKKINFIDTTGNAYINCPPAFFFIKGMKNKNATDKQMNNPFTQAGLKLIYAVLDDTNLINAPHRIVANRSGVALGTVGKILKALEKQDHIVQMGRYGKKLINKKKLLEKWCLEYLEKLKPKILLGRFEGPEDFAQKAQLTEFNALWGGEMAAFELTMHMKPEEYIIYAEANQLSNIVIHNRLKKADTGNIEIYKAFWPTDQYVFFTQTVPPILIYADLLEFKDQRKLETAKVIYDEYILEHLGQD
jgi:hypothetical protein